MTRAFWRSAYVVIVLILQMMLQPAGLFAGDDFVQSLVPLRRPKADDRIGRFRVVEGSLEHVWEGLRYLGYTVCVEVEDGHYVHFRDGNGTYAFSSDVPFTFVGRTEKGSGTGNRVCVWLGKGLGLGPGLIDSFVW